MPLTNDDRQTDKTDCFTPCSACVHRVMMSDGYKPSICVYNSNSYNVYMYVHISGVSSMELRVLEHRFIEPFDFNLILN